MKKKNKENYTIFKPNKHTMYITFSNFFMLFETSVNPESADQDQHCFYP